MRVNVKMKSGSSPEASVPTPSVATTVTTGVAATSLSWIRPVDPLLTRIDGVVDAAGEQHREALVGLDIGVVVGLHRDRRHGLSGREGELLDADG